MAFAAIDTNLDAPLWHEYDAVFQSALYPSKVNTNISRQACAMRYSTLQAWLTDLVQPLGWDVHLGRVPVKIFGLRAGTRCLEVSDDSKDRAVPVEFVVHRYGDSAGVHYAATVSQHLPYKLYSFSRLGSVSSDLLWGLSRLQEGLVHP